tara:strand:- start:80 stop:508 length:429 start_codon:yes stop_codon:yes gene_type:complete
MRKRTEEQKEEYNAYHRAYYAKRKQDIQDKVEEELRNDKKKEYYKDYYEKNKSKFKNHREDVKFIEKKIVEDIKGEKQVNVLQEQLKGLIENFDDYKKEWVANMDKQIENLIAKRFEKKKKKDDFNFSEYVDSNNFTMSFDL